MAPQRPDPAHTPRKPATDEMTLAEVRRQLNSMQAARLLAPFNAEEDRRYTELLEAELRLMGLE